MIKRILLALTVLGFCLLASPMSAQAKDILGSAAECHNGSAGTGSSAICTDDATAQSNPSSDPVVNALEKIARIIGYAAGVAAVLLLLVGSIQYITSGGDSNKISSAKNTIIYALIGVIIVALAAVIIEFVLNNIK